MRPTTVPVYPRGMPRRDPWTQEAISALGNKPDVDIAKMIGVRPEAVRQKRVRLGIPTAGPQGPRPVRGKRPPRSATG